MKVQFVRDADFSIDGKPVTYKAGEVHDLRDDLAQRWKSRGAAVDYVPPPPPPKPAKEEAKATDGKGAQAPAKPPAV